VVAQIATLDAGGTVSPSEARAVERRTRAAGPLPYALALVATSFSEVSAPTREKARAEAVAIAERCGASALVDRALRACAGDDVGDEVTRERDTARSAPAGRLTVCCLGGFALLWDGEPIPLDGLRPQPQTVLRVLALHANRTVHRERLADWVWSGRGTDRSGHNLQVAVSAIRKILEDAPIGGRAAVVREGEGYRLALPSDDDSDLRRLERLMASAASHAQAGDDDRAAADYRRAVDEYRGEVLPDVGPAEWVLDARARVDASVADALEWLSDHASQRGEPREAAGWARRGLELDRYRDSLWRRAIAATRAAGDPVAAGSLEADYAALCAELEVRV
jgi:DNA-binding SARP family transcriptional activator